MSPKKKLILVTGASGFVGAQVVDHCLQAGYGVRGTCRSGKAQQLRNNCQHPNFEVTVVDDLVNADFSTALQDVAGIIHAATPVPGHNDDMLKTAIGGTLNILRQAHASKVYDVCIIGSLSSTVTHIEDLSNPSNLITEKDWNSITEDAANALPYASPELYIASKALAERSAWAFAAAHPAIHLTALLPPFIFGPLSPTQVATSPAMLATNQFVHMLVSGLAPPLLPPHCVDVRDVARAAVLALFTRNAPGQARILLRGGGFTWAQAARHLTRVKPELKARLPVDCGYGEDSGEARAAGVDTRRAREELGFASFIGWREMLEDAVKSLVEREGAWSA